MRGSTIDIVVILAISLLVAPLAAEAQPAGKVYRIGILGLGPYPSEAQRQQSPFLQELRELGWHEGQNLGFQALLDVNLRLATTDYLSNGYSSIQTGMT